MSTPRIDYLADQPQTARVIARWFQAEWRPRYGTWKLADVEAEILEGMSLNALPLTLVAFMENAEGSRPSAVAPRPVGTVSLRSSSFEDLPPENLPPLGPWLGGLYVAPEHRRRGLALALLERAASEARALAARSGGGPRLYAGTATAQALFERAGWTANRHIEWDGVLVTIFARPL